MIFNLEINLLDKSGRLRSSLNGGLHRTEQSLEKAKLLALSKYKNVSFDVYSIQDPLAGMYIKR
jgi:hypothetical protein